VTLSTKYRPTSLHQLQKRKINHGPFFICLCTAKIHHQDTCCRMLSCEGWGRSIAGDSVACRLPEGPLDCLVPHLNAALCSDHSWYSARHLPNIGSQFMPLRLIFSPLQTSYLLQQQVEWETQRFITTVTRASVKGFSRSHLFIQRNYGDLIVFDSGLFSSMKLGKLLYESLYE
jgi:hypothetical protein